MPISAVATGTNTLVESRPPQYSATHHNNVVNIGSRRREDVANNAEAATLQPDDELPPALIIALGLVAATQLAVIALRLFTL